MTAKEFRDIAARSGLTDEELARYLGVAGVDVLRFKYDGRTGRKIERRMRALARERPRESPRPRAR